MAGVPPIVGAVAMITIRCFPPPKGRSLRSAMFWLKLCHVYRTFGDGGKTDVWWSDKD